jgi:hypothetical protein
MSAKTPLFKLPSDQSWWAVQSLMKGTESLFRIWHLVWGRNEEEAAVNFAADHEELDRSLMNGAIRRGEIASESEWVSLSRLISHERMVRVTTIDEVERLDKVLAAMLREHEGFEIEFAKEGPSVIGGGWERIQ